MAELSSQVALHISALALLSDFNDSTLSRSLDSAGSERRAFLADICKHGDSGEKTQ